MKRFIFLIIVVIVIAAGLSGAWLFAAQTIKTQILENMVAQNTDTQSVQCEQLSVTGFPFRFDVTCTHAEFVDFDTHILIPQIKGTVLVYRPTHLLAFLEGPMQINDDFSGAKRTLSWDSLKLSVRSDKWTFARFSLEAEALVFSDNIVGEIELARLDHFEAHLLDMPELHDEITHLNELTAFTRAQGLTLPQLDLVDADLILEAQIAAMPDDVRNWSPQTFRTNWANNPAAINVQKFEGADVRSSFSAVGQFGLTDAALLTGDIDLFTTNIAERLNSYVAGPMLQLILGLPDNNGGLYQSYAVRHGVLMAGNIPLWAIPPLF